ncbi:MAG: hypothetical protein D6722_21420 [Bacteroidetes bacterium]|nr:MAG: hypothetical protein D6722_21420 [Bacteroidota bacterium]
MHIPSRTRSLLLLCLPVSLLLLHCERDKEVILPHTYEIFPQTEGLTRISLVADTTYTTAGIEAPDIDSYYKQEVQAGIEQDLNGRNLRLVELSRSELVLGTNYDFIPFRTATHYLEPVAGTTYFGERIENNQRVQVLKFPVHSAQRWNGNLYNNQNSEIFEYAQVDTTVTIRGHTYENCVMVLQKLDTAGVIRKEFAYEIYAPGIGLIKKYDRTLVFDQPDGGFNPSASRIYFEELIEAF